MPCSDIIVGTIAVGTSPLGIQIISGGTKVYVSNFVGVIQVSRHSPRFAIGAPLPEPFFMQLACHPFVHCNSRSLTFVSALKWTFLVDTKAILSAYPSITAPSG